MPAGRSARTQDIVTPHNPIAFALQGCDPGTLVGVAGSHWHIEHAFDAAKQEVGVGRSAESWLARDAGPAGSHAGGRTGPVALPKKGDHK